MKSPSELLVELWYGELSHEEIRAWAYCFAQENDEIPEEVFELLDADRSHQEALLLKLARASGAEFSSQSSGAEKLAAKFLIVVATRYFDGDISPEQVCRVVNSIDSDLLGAPRGLPPNVAYYPEWLGSLYHDCDWCDESWTASNAPHLAQALQEQINAIEGWLRKSYLE